MNLSETLQLLDKLRALGVTRFKDGGFEVDLSRDMPITIHMPSEPVATNAEPPSEPKYTPTRNEENTRKAEALIDLLKRKDEDILNHIFPEGA